MPVPTPADFDHLSDLVAISDAAARSASTISEVFTGRPLGVAPIGTADDVRAAVAEAHAAQADWAARPVHERAAVIERYRNMVLDHRDFLMDVVQAETGKARWTAQEECLGIIAVARYYARHAPKILRPYRVRGPLPLVTKSVVHHQPCGVVGVIAPWNYPMFLAIGDALPALVAGNAVVLKPAGRTPFSALANAELLYCAGLPRELFAVVPGSGEVVGAALVDTCDYLMFTGSAATGRQLAQQCGQRLVAFSAELGGKNPMIVTEGANLAKAAKVARRACFGNAGQLCLSVERIYVECGVAEEFTAKFVAATESMVLAAGYDFRADMGSLASTDQLETVTKHLADAKSKGAEVRTGGNPRPDIGPLFFEPTVLTGVTDQMECARNETFGPLVSIYPVADVDEAVARANDTEYGLSASVFAESPAYGETIAVRLRSGAVNVDEGYLPAAASPGAPMGGMGSSGIGRRHGPAGLLKYTEPQTVATTRVIDLDAPPAIASARWRGLEAPLAQLISRLPGR